MSDQSYIGETLDDWGAYVARLRTDKETSKRAMRRGIAAVAVAILHVLFFFLLIWAEWIPGLHFTRQQEPPLLWLLLARPAGVQSPVQPRQGKDEEHKPPVTFVPPPVTPPEQSTAINPAYALGEALACGASSYEYLTPEGRTRCKHAPWAYKYDKQGVIVLDATPRIVQEKPRISDIQAHERNTMPVCPKYIDSNAPCLYEVIHGKQ